MKTYFSRNVLFRHLFFQNILRSMKDEFGENEGVFFITNISNYKNLSQILHRCQGLEEPLSLFQPIFLIAQNPV